MEDWPEDGTGGARIGTSTGVPVCYVCTRSATEGRMEHQVSTQMFKNRNGSLHRRW